MENKEEQQYLSLVKQILKEGEKQIDRTNVGTLSVFGPDIMRFSLKDRKIPILTTKKVFWKGVVEELLWMIRGSTDSKELSSRGVTIWDGNGTREYLDSINLKDRSVGDLGPVYGFQWRHFGADYIDCKSDYTSKGTDQLKWLINEIKTKPNSRRLILNSWNASQIHLMSLPPCHVMAQFRVVNNELSCLMTQRSADMGLGVPFNIASYSLLTHLIAHVCGLKVGMFVYSLGDAHIYLNHIEAMKEQIQRTPFSFPTLILPEYKRDKTEIEYLEQLEYKDVRLVDYKSHEKIEMRMAV